MFSGVHFHSRTIEKSRPIDTTKSHKLILTIPISIILAIIDISFGNRDYKSHLLKGCLIIPLIIWQIIVDYFADIFIDGEKIELIGKDLKIDADEVITPQLRQQPSADRNQ